MNSAVTDILGWRGGHGPVVDYYGIEANFDKDSPEESVLAVSYLQKTKYETKHRAKPILLAH